jgi:anthranilate phosphoribosyltransferase
VKNILHRLINQEVLTKKEAKKCLIEISSGAVNEHQIAAFITVFLMRNITIEELIGFREALLELAIPVSFDGLQTIDLCGTGGDGKDTFNISTLASFIVAGAGFHVAKHGNYGISSISGSSNVMEQMGVKFTNNQSVLQKCMEKANIAILHAPLFHPAMKQVAPIRKQLGVKTFFNMLGPMVNPAKVTHQMVGVFSLELARIYAYLYQNTNVKYTILYGLEGFDEISLTDSVKVITNQTEQILTPNDFSFSKVNLTEIHGGHTIEASAKIFSSILHGKGTSAQNNVVLANAAMAIHTISGKDYNTSLALAKESLEGKKALEKLNLLIQITNN